MTWESEKSNKLAALKDFSDQIGQKKRPLIEFLENTDFPATTNPFEWCLLATALNQGISETKLCSFLIRLNQAIGTQIFKLPAPKLSTLEDLIAQEPGLNHWVLRKNAPGIIWSVGAFIRDHTPFSDYLDVFSARQIVSDVRKSVFYMGRYSPIPNKALWFIQNLILPKPLGLAVKIEDGFKIPAPVSSGARRWLALIGPNPSINPNTTSAEKLELEYFNKLYAKCDPKNPGKMAWALQLFLDKSEGTFRCRSIIGGCELCSINKWCKYRV